MHKRWQHWIGRLQSFADRPWYFPLVGLLAGLDLFILVVPVDAILISSVILQPKKWVSAFFWVALGSSLGAALLAGLLQWDSELVMQVWFPGAFNSSAWQSMDAFFDHYGAVAVFLIAVSPLVQFPVVGIAALAGMSVFKIFLLMLAGRMLKCALVSWGASHAPKLLMKLPLLKKELQAITPPLENSEKP